MTLKDYDTSLYHERLKTTEYFMKSGESKMVKDAGCREAISAGRVEQSMRQIISIQQFSRVKFLPR